MHKKILLGGIVFVAVFCSVFFANGAQANLTSTDSVTTSTSLITVTSPNGGESWVIGEAYVIKWAQSDDIEKV